MKKFLIVIRATILVNLLCGWQTVIADDAADKFFANQSLQSKAPAAFVLQPEAREFLLGAFGTTEHHAKQLAAAIVSDPELTQALAKWPQLSFKEQVPYLRKIFNLECRLLKFTPPKLLIDTTSFPDRLVNFVFDPEAPSPGTVYLNPEKFKTQPPYAALAFVLHETRHSYQFQKAFQSTDVEAMAYQNAFRAQKALKGFSFSDFLTLANEYEAFQFANYVIGVLTNWQVDMTGMGTFASQFDHKGQLKINLASLAKEESDTSLLQAYNQLAKAQFELRQKKKSGAK